MDVDVTYDIEHCAPDVTVEFVPEYGNSLITLNEIEGKFLTLVYIAYYPYHDHIGCMVPGLGGTFSGDFVLSFLEYPRRFFHAGPQFTAMMVNAYKLPYIYNNHHFMRMCREFGFKFVFNSSPLNIPYCHIVRQDSSKHLDEKVAMSLSALGY